MEADEQGCEAGDGSLLVVDDNPYDLRILKQLLEREGYAVHGAGDAESARSQVRVCLPGLILLDVKLPGMDGYQLCQHLKAEEATRDVPVIFISGGDEASAKVRAFKSGGVDYITKPFHHEEVLARVATHLALHGLQRRLEERVRQRSSVLALANARLQREITQRRQAEERFRGMLEAAPDAMVIVNQHRQIVLVNTRAESLFGYDRSELLGQSVEMLMPERYRQAHSNYGDSYIVAPRPRSMGETLDLFALRRDGTEFPVELSLSPLLTGGTHLVITAIRDVSLRKGIERELLESRQRLRDLTTHRETVREQERKRIAGEIHDELGSLLTALKMDIALLRMQLGENPSALDRLGQMRELVERTIRMVRQVATCLRPAALNLGLVAALEWLVEDFQRRTGVVCSLQADAEVAMEDAHATAVFRIVQESLTNVARHAAASRVHVALVCSEEGMELSVEDDGRGFDPAGVAPGSFGLIGMRERALILGGEARVDSSPGSGSRVSIRIPLPEAAA